MFELLNAYILFQVMLAILNMFITFIINCSQSWLAVARECALYHLLDNAFLETTYKAEYFLASRWLANWGFSYVRALQNILQSSINGLHFTPYWDLASVLLLQTISFNDTPEPWPHLKALDFCHMLESQSPWITTFQQPPRELRVFYCTYYILINTYSVLFIKDKAPSQIL